MSIPANHTWTLIPFSNEKNKNPWRNFLIWGLGQNIYKVILEHCLVQKIKCLNEVILDCLLKAHRSDDGMLQGDWLMRSLMSSSRGVHWWNTIWRHNWEMVETWGGVKLKEVDQGGVFWGLYLIPSPFLPGSHFLSVSQLLWGEQCSSAVLFCCDVSACLSA